MQGQAHPAHGACFQSRGWRTRRRGPPASLPTPSTPRLLAPERRQMPALWRHRAFWGVFSVSPWVVGQSGFPCVAGRASALTCPGTAVRTPAPLHSVELLTPGATEEAAGLLVPAAPQWEGHPLRACGAPRGAAWGSAGRGDGSRRPATACVPVSPCHPSPRLARGSIWGAAPCYHHARPRKPAPGRDDSKEKSCLAALLRTTPTCTDSSHPSRNNPLPKVSIPPSALRTPVSCIQPPSVDGGSPEGAGPWRVGLCLLHHPGPRCTGI